MTASPPAPTDPTPDPTPDATRAGPRAGPFQLALGAVALIAVLLLTTWPLALSPLGHLLGDPDIEPVEHLWTLWLGARHGPLVIDTDLASFPFGYRWVLADPLNLLCFLPAGLWSAVLGMHTVEVANLLLSGLAAVVAGRWLLPSAQEPATADPRLPLGSSQDWAVASVAIAAPTLAGHLVSGMTEAATVWAAVLAVTLLKPALERGGRWVGLAALAAGAAAWGGPYTGVYTALLAPILLLAVLPSVIRSHGAKTALLRLCGVVLPAVVLASPVAWAILTQRPAGLPGTESMLTQVLTTPAAPHTRYLGADLLAVVLPWRDGELQLLQATYLGVGALLLGVVGIVKRRARLMGGLLLWAIVLGLGVYLQLGGWIPRVGGRILLLPAGLLSLVLPLLGRAARWHRMLGIGSILLAPLVVAGASSLVAVLPPRLRSLGLWTLVSVVVADMIFASSVPWPRPVLDAQPPAIFAALDQPGPVMLIPKQPRRVPGLPRAAGRQLLWQTVHERPIAEKPMFQKTDVRLHALREQIRVGALRGDSQKAGRGRRGLFDLGYTWIVHLDEPGNPVRADQLQAVLGAPDVQAGDGMAWRTR